MIRRAADFATSRMAARSALIACAAVMVALFLALIAMMIVYGSGTESRLIASSFGTYFSSDGPSGVSITATSSPL